MPRVVKRTANTHLLIAIAIAIAIVVLYFCFVLL